MDSESWSEGIFPPHPATVYGFLRSVYFEINMDDFSKANTSEDPTSNLRVHEFNLVRKNERTQAFEKIFPVPAALIKKDDATHCPSLKEYKGHSNYPFSHILSTDMEGKYESYKTLDYITETQLDTFLKGSKKSMATIPLHKWLLTEERLGIAKDISTGVTKDGHLYRMQFTNGWYKDKDENYSLHFHVCFSGLELPEVHSRRLGGEAKLARLEKIMPQDTLQGAGELLHHEVDLLYLTSPAIVGSLEKLKADFRANNLEILAIANLKNHAIGGWDIQEKKPKPMRSALPAGSVLYLRPIREQKTTLNDILAHGIGEDTQQGFGQCKWGKTQVT